MLTQAVAIAAVGGGLGLIISLFAGLGWEGGHPVWIELMSCLVPGITGGAKAHA